MRKNLIILMVLPSLLAIDPQNWIGDNLNSLGDKTLKNITLTGTHDSGAYYLTSHIMPDAQPELLQAFTKIGQALLTPLPDVIKAWALAQDRSFYDQMKGGIRYFDLRSGWYSDLQEWVTFHFLIGNPVQILLQDIAKFLKEHPKQIVVVEVSHFDGDPSDSDIQELKNLIVQELGEFLYPVDYGFEFTVNDMVNSGKTALVTMEKGDFSSENIWSGDTIHNTYADSDVVDNMINYNEEQVKNYANSPWQGQLFKVSWTLTPNADTILDSLIFTNPHSLIELAQKGNPYLPTFWLQIKQEGLRTGNILIIDDFESSEILSVILDMNGLLTRVETS